MSAEAEGLSHIRFISAGAGSGKTYRLTEELERALVGDKVRPAGVIGTTFTVKAASELRDRVRLRLIQRGRAALAEQMQQALIGTVHSVCQSLLTRFAFELGLSPSLNVASAEDGARLFNQALDEVLDPVDIAVMNRLAVRLSLVDDRNRSDWQTLVKRVADQARNNNIDAGGLPAMGRDSAAAFLAYFPQPFDGDQASRALGDAIKRALEKIDLAVDTTRTTRQFVEKIRSMDRRLATGDCPWTQWISVAKKGPAKRSAEAGVPVQAAAACYDSHAGFQGDIRAYVEGVFQHAADALVRFQAIKTERGLVDFSDMEQLTLRALDEPSVAERLGEELELLLVDEFQDTNPMQLGLFMKLARFAREVVFVGDIKQAIYGFRGTDPQLIERALAALAARGSEPAVLERSWRSRPALVRHVNAVFTRAFASDGMPPEMVELRPERVERQHTPAVIRWDLAKGSSAAQAPAIASAIAELVASDMLVTDPHTDVSRPVGYGDVAVLAATNANVEAIARALRDHRVPMKMTLSGLLEVPEVCLVMACLRRLNDPSDTLASAEIRALGRCEEPENWLTDRLRWLAAGQPGQSWGESDDPMLARIALMRAQAATRSPVEIVASVLCELGLRPVVTAWGPDAARAAQRQRNLDAVLDLAVEYENHCASQHDAATLTGFLFWLDAPKSAELDVQPVPAGGDAVHVLTYHRAKGLEWPVVVATDFHYARRTRLWDVRTTADGEAFDLDEPLRGRRIRLYPKVFGHNVNDVPVLDRVLASQEVAALDAADDAEGRRLAYVGLTRARDVLAMAVPAVEPQASAWIHTFDSEYLLPDGDSLALPDGASIATVCRALRTPAEAPVAAPPFAPSWFLQRTPVTHSRERLSPSAAQPIAGARIGEVLEIGPRIPIHGQDLTRIGIALHAVFAAEFVNPERSDAGECARRLIETLAAKEAVAVDAAIACARRLRRAVTSRFAPRRTLVEYPVQLAGSSGEVLRGWVDLLVETPDGWIVIDHKSSPRPRNEWQTEALEHSGQLAAYADALGGAGLRCAGCWVHFPVSGGLVEVVLET